MDILKLGYILLTVGVIFFLFFIGNYAIERTSEQPKKDKLILFGGMILWQVYIYLVSWTGFMISYDFPPRFAMLLILPLFVFTTIFLFRNKDSQRRRLAAKALGRKGLFEIRTLVTPDTLLRWYRTLIAKKYDGTMARSAGRPKTAAELEQLIVQMARDNPTWGS